MWLFLMGAAPHRAHAAVVSFTNGFFCYVRRSAEVQKSARRTATSLSPKKSVADAAAYQGAGTRALAQIGSCAADHYVLLLFVASSAAAELTTRAEDYRADIDKHNRRNQRLRARRAKLTSKQKTSRAEDWPSRAGHRQAKPTSRADDRSSLHQAKRRCF